jgi:C-terminal processing protease CtpA/Prc
MLRVTTASLTLLALLSLAFAQPPASAVDSTKLIQDKLQQVSELWRQGDYVKAIPILEELRTYPKVQEMDWAWQAVLYNLACGYSLLGQKEKAVDFLREAVEAGYTDLQHMESDTDLDSIRSAQGYKQIAERVKRRQYLWENPFINTPYKENLSVDEKVAGLSKLWSEIKYNFVYFERVPGLNWDSLYMAFLPKVQQTQNTLDYYRALQEMCGHLKDGHTGVNWPPALYDQVYGWPPIRTRLIEGCVLITKVFDDSLLETGIRPGLEILRIDGLPVKDYANSRIAPFARASTPQGLAEQLHSYQLLNGAKESPVELELRDSKGKILTRTLSRTPSKKSAPTPDVEFKMLRGNIAYMAINTFSNESAVTQFDSLFPLIQKADALILDLRENGGGNSGTGFRLLGYLTEDSFRIGRWVTREYRPMYRAWGRSEREYEEPQSLWPPQGSKHFAKPVTVLISARTGSAAEDFCVAYDVMNRGPLIGEPTCGSTGQPLIFSLPGGGNAFVCTAHCFYPDGKEFVGVGVLPDIKVHPTVKDVRAGKDPVLTAAIEWLKHDRDK